jgi:hypothetical protein
MKKILFAAVSFLAAVSLSASADGTNVGVDANAQAFAGAFASPTINNTVVGGSGGGGAGRPTLFMPNAAASTLPNVNQFVKSGAGPAEKGANISRFLAKACNFAGGAKLEIIKGDNATMLWLPYPDYTLVKNNGGGSVFEPFVTDMANEFATRDPSVTHYCLGQVTIKPIRDDENSDLYDPLILANEALRVLKDEGVLYGNITPVVLYDQVGYVETTEAEGSGLSITPQITGGPAAVSLVAGSMFSWQKNGGWVSPNYRLVLKIVLLEEAPNESLGHPIIGSVQNDIRLYAEEAERNKQSQRSETENGAKKGVQSIGSRR